MINSLYNRLGSKRGTADGANVAVRQTLDEQPDTRPVRQKFSDAGKTARTPRPTFASRIIRAANDRVRNAWGEGPTAMPVPA